jgi:hypothetical protein
MFAARRVFQRTLGRRNMSIWESGNDVKTLRKKYYENHTQGKPDCADVDDMRLLGGDSVNRGRYLEGLRH